MTVQEENTIEDDEIKQMDTDDGISFLEKTLQNLSIDIEIDDETFIASPLAKKAKCSTPMAKKEENYTKPKQGKVYIRLLHVVSVIMDKTGYYCFNL